MSLPEHVEGYKCKNYISGPSIGWHLGGGWCKVTNTPANCWRCFNFARKEES